MCASLVVMVMSSSFFNPSFAFNSQFDSDGAPLSELSWSSSLAVVAVSFSGLFTFIFLMLACLCCKKGDIGFKEFDNAESEDYRADLSTLGSPASQGGPEVYILPLTEVSLPVSRQPGRSVQLLKSSDLGRQSLLYLKEIGHGWFGKVLLGEVNAGLSTIQVVVKELKASASVQHQMQFLEEAQPYRALQHPALLQCLAQCSEVTPYLLVMEFCPLGDLKGYLRSCLASDSMTPDPLILQRMACEITSGLLHLHKNNYIHSDLALRNCLLTAEVTVKIGDYGLSHNKYKEDYFVTTDQLWVPLRWIAPELVDEVHGNLLVVDHTKPSNVWSLGVTIWELFELGNQPYRHYSDRQVLTYAVKEQQLKLPKPLMKVPLLERWYEVMQFCWLQPDQRPTTEEVHLLLSYLCAKGASGAEEDFEKRWNSLRPNGGGHCGSHGGAPPAGLPSSCSSSSFPLLERFSAGDSYHSEPGDDILTVTETSQGLNFEYKWEQARPAERPFCSSSASGPLGQSNPHYQDIYYPAVGMTGGCRADGLTLGISPSYYEPKHLHAPGVVPVLSAHSPSVSSEYYIRIEEPVECAMDLDYTMCAYSPGFEGSNGSFLTGSGDSGECVNCASEAPPSSYWSADGHKTSTYDSDTSPAISLTMEPLLGQESSPVQPWEAGHYVSYKDKDGGYYYEHSPSIGIDHYLMGEPCEPQQESWGSRSLRQALGELENPLGVSPSLIGPEQGYIDPYLEGSQGPGESVVSECYYDMMGSLRKAMPVPRPVGIDIETGAALFLGRGVNNLDEEDPFIKDEGSHWTSNHSANNNSMNFPRQPPVGVREAYADLHYTMPSTDVEDSWPRMKIKEDLPFVGAEPLSYLEAIPREGGCMALGKHCAPFSSGKHDAYIYLCHEVGEEVVSPVTCLCTVDGPNFIDPLSGAVVRNYALSDYVREKTIAGGAPHTENKVNVSRLPEERLLSKAQLLDAKIHLTMPDCPERQTNITPVGGVSGEIGALKLEEVTALKDTAIVGASALSEKSTLSADPNSESSQTTDSGVERGHSSISLVDIGDCSDDDDITDVTSGIFVDFPTYYAETEDPPGTLKPLQKQTGTPDSVDSIDLPSAVGPREAFSPNPFQASSPPKAMDSGYDTENNESPEFVLKEPHEPRDSEGLALCGSLDAGVTEATLILQTELDQEVVVADTEHELTALREKDPYRDSAYFSDYDTDNERFSQDKGYKPPERLDGAGFVEQEAKQKSPVRHTEKEEPKLPCVERKEQSLSACPEEGRDIRRDIKNNFPRGELSGTDISAPVFSTLSPSPPEMGGCLTKESSQDEGLGLDSEHSGEEPSSECSSSSTASGGFPDQQMPLASGNKDQKETGSLEDSLAEPLASDSTSGDSDAGVLLDINDEEGKEQENSEISMNLQEEKEKEVVEEEQQKSQEALSEAEETQGKDGEEQAALEIPDIDTSPSLSSPPPVADGDEADSEDSEGSDEELRCYNVQELSEDSEEEFPTVPIIVSDCSEASRLRSLLKMPTLLTQSFCNELDRKKKAVSFFDDVTVYLFDQESPTRELAEQGFLPSAESCGQGSGCSEPSHQEKANAFDDSSDGNVSEESGGFEWEDDFPLLSSTSSVTSAPTEKSANTSQSTITPETAPSAQYSRFTVSRFSITHVSDSDVDSVGGSSEDGERE